MNKNVEKVLDATVEVADSVYGTTTDRAVERFEQVGENIEKDKATAKRDRKSVV